MQFQGLPAGRLQYRRHYSLGSFRSQDATRVLENDPVNIEGERFADFAGKVIVGVTWRHGVDQIDNRLESSVLCLFNAPSPIRWIIPRIEDAHLGYTNLSHTVIDNQLQHFRVHIKFATRS